MNINNVTIGGRLGKDPEMKTVNDKAITTFSVCWNDYNKTGHWFNCVAFGKTAEVIAGHVHAGDSVGVTGQVQIDTWDDKATGAKRSAPKIVVRDFSFGEKAKKNQAPASQSQPAPEDDQPPF